MRATIENLAFLRDPVAAYATDFNPPGDLMAPLRHRAKKKGTQRDR
jgi:hypothetical protein